MSTQASLPENPASAAPGALPTVVLVRPQESGNVGAAARAMANTGLSRLVLVEPAAPVNGTARAFATGGVHILDGVRRVPDLASALAGCGRVVGTTSDRQRDRAVPALTPRELAELLATDPPGTPVGLVFGPERSGLTTAELALCGVVVTIPCAPAHPTLNLAQAVLLVTHELFLAREASGSASGPPAEPLASAAELAALVAHAEEILRAARFARHAGFDHVLRDLGALLARAAPTRREVRTLRGVCRRLGHALRLVGSTPGEGPSRAE